MSCEQLSRVFSAQVELGSARRRAISVELSLRDAECWCIRCICETPTVRG